jgi:hypothetical protein
LLEGSNRAASHVPNIEWIRVVPRDESVGNVFGVEFTALDEASRDTQCLFGVVGNRSGWLIPRSVPGHFIETAVLCRDFRGSIKLDWPSECIPTGKSQQDSTSLIQLHACLNDYV